MRIFAKSNYCNNYQYYYENKKIRQTVSTDAMDRPGFMAGVHVGVSCNGMDGQQTAWAKYLDGYGQVDFPYCPCHDFVAVVPDTAHI